MSGDKHTLTQLMGKPTEHQHQIQTRGKVKMCRRLVEQNKWCVLSQSPSHHHALPLTITELSNKAVLHPLQVTLLYGFSHHFLVFTLKFAEEVRIGIASKRNDIPHGHIPPIYPLSQYQT